MAKTRIYEIARQLNYTSKELVKKLNELGFKVKSSLNSIEKETAERMISLILRDSTKNTTTIKSKTISKSPAVSHKKKRSAEKGVARTSSASKTISLAGPIEIRKLAKLMGIKSKILIKQLKTSGYNYSINNIVSIEEAMEITDQFGFDIEEIPLEFEGTEFREKDLKENTPRSAVVAVLGHVDHGKTSLLDYIRRTKVASREDGGITQHIGAYQVSVNNEKITFIDTPGHEAFTAMRARGAQITDLVILVVAADDGVMPQTIEAINHAKSADVPIIVAVNKIDKENANPAKVRQDLLKYELVSEEIGGETIFCDISAKNGTGIQELLEMIVLQAEMLELSSNSNLPGRGTIIEAKLDKGRGPVVTVLIESGTIKKGDSFVAGLHSGKVRAIIDDQNKEIKQAGPSSPVEIIGLSGVPKPGDALIVLPSDKKAKQLAQSRQKQSLQKDKTQIKEVSLEKLFEQANNKIKELKVILKTDVQGSLEAINDAFNKLKSKKVDVQIIHQAVGTIVDTDVNLAATSGAIIIGYRVKPISSTINLANQLGVEIKLYRVIYELIEEIEKAMIGMLDPEFDEVEMGRALIKELFQVQKVGVVAGCFVESGKIQSDNLVRVLRDSIIIYEGLIDSLKHYKDNVKEVISGQDCGIHIENYNDIKLNDVIEAYAKKKIEAKL